MKRLWIAPLALAALLLAGCPKPPQQKTTSPSPGTRSAGPGGASGGSEGGGPTDPTAPSGGAGGAAPWPLFPKELMEDKDFYPQLTGIGPSWPDPVSLRAPEQLPEGQRPQEVRLRNLRELVELIVAKDLQPSDSKAALGVDERGRLFMKLGRGKAVGSASLETRPEKSPFPIFAMTLELPAKGPHTIESLRARVAKVVAPGLVEEMKREGDHQLQASPRIQGDARMAGMAILDPKGRFGIQFPYVYAFADDQRLVVLLQEVPHMSQGALPQGK
ncbi:MAG: hypothetical protein AB7G23_19380 [Vicinamibacterales bacterium]